MEEIKLAVRLLLSNNKTITPEALVFFKSSKDPVELAQKIINKFPTNTVIDKSLLSNLTSNSVTAKSSAKTSTVKKSKSSTSSRQVPQSQTVITTSLDELSNGLLNYESELTIVKEPILSKNLVGNINDMVGYFQDRFKKLSRIFKGRIDVTNLTKISHVKKDQRDISVIGMLTEKILKSDEDGKSGRLILEDPRSEHSLEVFLTQDFLVEKALHTMTDTVICVQGMVNEKGMFFANDFLLPDIPQRTISSLNTADIPVHAAFLSDIHVGSKGFLSEPMEKFVEFLNGEYGNIKEQKLGLNTKYVMFSGDVVDGVGIYPGQQDDLAMDSIHDQYNAFASFIDEIPDDIEVVVIPGNHDMVRSAEPQPSISPEYAPDLANFENVHLLPNPSQVGLHGVKTLLYHCTSLPDILNHIPGLSIDRPVDVMQYMLKARHLAPIWGDKTPIATEPEDHLVIDPIPDIFHGGHVHINGWGRYRGVSMINSGTMQEQTSYQKSLNIDPTPGIVPLLNLQNRKYSQIDFMTD